MGDELLLDLRQFDHSANQSEEVDYLILAYHFAQNFNDCQMVFS